MEERAAQRIEVAPHVDVARVPCLLGTDVVECAQGHAGLGQPVVAAALESARQAHVHQLGATLRRQDDIGRLDVAMDHAPLRRVHQRVGDLEGDVDGLGDGQRAGLLHALADRHAFNIFKGDVVQISILTDTIHAGNILVVELGRGSSLLVEPADHFPVGRLVGRQELERDEAFELRIERPEDGPHPAGADRFLEPEGVDQLARQRQWDRSRRLGEAPFPHRRAVRAPEYRHHRVRLRELHDVNSRLALEIGGSLDGIIGRSARLGAQHRLMLNGSGFVPWKYILAKRSMQTVAK
jgi:hypothetical protein